MQWRWRREEMLLRIDAAHDESQHTMERAELAAELDQLTVAEPGVEEGESAADGELSASQKKRLKKKAAAERKAAAGEGEGDTAGEWSGPGCPVDVVPAGVTTRQRAYRAPW